MEDAKLIDASKEQLTRVLGFFPRVDTVASVVLGVDLGMLALIANRALPLKTFEWQMAFAAIPVLLVGFSLFHLFRGYFPRLKGGWLSLTYFREIAQREEAEFIREFRALNEQTYIDDLLSQVWRNSEILTQKFDHLSKAFMFLAWAILPWLIALVLLTSRTTETTTKVITGGG
jgi:hypothetical protein